jgi:hypothetical protein
MRVSTRSGMAPGSAVEGKRPLLSDARGSVAPLAARFDAN